jgi:ABC-type glycerol-3-phosphate transport system permease component
MGRLCAARGMENSAPLFNNQRCPRRRVAHPVTKLLDTLVITLSTLPFTLITNSAAAYAITRNRHRSTFFKLIHFYFKSAFASDYGAMFAAIVLISIPSIIGYIALQRQIISGLAAGGG